MKTEKEEPKPIDELVLEGVNISRIAHPRDALYESDPDFLDALFKRYVIWRHEIRIWAGQEYIGRKIDPSVFFEGDSVGNFKAGIEYGDIRSKESQELIKNIRNETKEKLKVLRKAKTEIYKIISPWNKNIQPIFLPLGTKWEDVSIEFLDGHNVQIKAKNLNCKVNYKDMGFQDNRELAPNIQWELLQDLAEDGGIKKWGRGADLKLRKRKQLLSEALKYCFQMKDDPFYNYKQEKMYRIKINLVSERSRTKIKEKARSEREIEEEDFYGNQIERY